MEMNKYLFVYGLYMEDMPLHHKIKDKTKFIRNYVVEGYRIYSCAIQDMIIPIMFHTGKYSDKVVGELYQIEDESLLNEINKNGSLHKQIIDCKLDWDTHISAISFVGGDGFNLWKEYVKRNGESRVLLYPNGVRWRC